MPRLLILSVVLYIRVKIICSRFTAEWFNNNGRSLLGSHYSFALSNKSGTQYWSRPNNFFYVKQAYVIHAHFEISLLHKSIRTKNTHFFIHHFSDFGYRQNDVCHLLHLLKIIACSKHWKGALNWFSGTFWIGMENTPKKLSQIKGK